MNRTDSRHRGGLGDEWRDLLPALGLILGAAFSLSLAVVGGQGVRIGLAIAIGAGVGLVLGSVIRGVQRRR